MPETDNDPQISYSVRGIIADLRSDMGAFRSEINANFARLFTLLDAKADRTDLMAVQDKVGRLGERIQVIEDERRDEATAQSTMQDQKATGKDRFRFIATSLIAVLTALLIAAATWLATVHG